MELRAEKGTKFIIDDEDYERIKNFRVYENINNKTYFFVSKGRNKGKCPLHRFLVNAPFDTVVDHANGDPSDNRKRNLRICTHRDNMRNKPGVKSYSGFKGVHYDISSRGYGRGQRKRWVASVQADGECYKKCASGKIDAALKYDQLARYYFGEFACLNFPLKDENGVTNYNKNYEFLAKSIVLPKSKKIIRKKDFVYGTAKLRNKHGFKGVEKKFNRKRGRVVYQARVYCEGKAYSKNAQNIVDAALKYDALARKLYKHKPCLNFPGEHEYGTHNWEQNLKYLEKYYSQQMSLF